ncbi:SDR family oxidoreductase [Actinopolymorpha pittospori]|uniref:NAD(P)-dependent dehydrogenase (Short-subunit alcohol dehydrogenase family) n=1 Tax=Actinopolymorpha pittospori TaxID=648752 RepID=A0A927N2P6_9ACTN|nr:SDR family oxidoreductase [Actinopolymorpha pittospori]MBE1611231.1 NAD(P)-dependent dehydrogenase (short-subunit alcohol dehydrogenase family) [Actinopolymorpha pittospori]
MTWSIEGRTVLVTGASNGLGLATSVELARRGATVVMVGRDLTRTTAAVEIVRARTGARPSYLLADFSSQASTRKLAAAFLDRHDRLDVLVNNAGGVHSTRRLTEDGIEATFAVNHLGYFLLTHLLLDRLLASAPARVVTVASAGHRGATLDFDDLGFERGYAIMKAYGRSKLANVLFAAELARRLEGSGVTSNSLHPGAVDTGIWSGAPVWAKPLIRVFARPFFASPQRGAEPIVRLVTDPALEDVTGRYFEKGVPVDPDPLAQDEAVAARLWDVSATLVRSI